MVTIDWGTSVINIPRTYMSLIQTTPVEVRQLDVSTLRFDLRALEASVEGMPFLKTHRHITEYTLSGVSYARAVEILAPYTVNFEDGQYSVSLYGANNNILDVKTPNQVSVLGNNSAGLVNSEAINDQSYLGASVYINTEGMGEVGTAFPLGTPPHPSSNYDDAHAIAMSRKLSNYHLDGTLVLTSLQEIEHTNWIGASPITSAILFSDQNMHHSTFHKLGITGTMNGRASYNECAIGGPLNVVGFQGVAEGCGLNGDITLEAAATENIVFNNCTSVIAGELRPIVDCNGTTADIHFRGWIGGLDIRNYTGGSNMSIDVISGSVVIANTCTAGKIVIRGVCELEDNSGPGCTVVSTGLITQLVNDSDKITDLHKLQGLDALHPMTVTPTTRSVDDIDQTISGDGQSVTVVTRT